VIVLFVRLLLAPLLLSLSPPSHPSQCILTYNTSHDRPRRQATQQTIRYWFIPGYHDSNAPSALQIASLRVARRDERDPFVPKSPSFQPDQAGPACVSYAHCTQLARDQRQPTLPRAAIFECLRVIFSCPVSVISVSCYTGRDKHWRTERGGGYERMYRRCKGMRDGHIHHSLVL
jgi:hypothetical protein